LNAQHDAISNICKCLANQQEPLYFDIYVNGSCLTRITFAKLKNLGFLFE